jgi:hypothetical protein
MVSSGLSFPVPSTNLQSMAQEFQKLAKGLKDGAPGPP